MVSYGLPFVPHHMQAVGLDLFGMYMVGNMLGLSAVGIYGIATKLSSPVSFVVGAVQASWVPYKFQIHAEDPDPHAFFSSSFLYYVAGLSYLWVGVSLWGPEVIRLMTTSQFHAATQLVWAVALIPVSQGIYFMCGTGIELSENTRIYPLVSFAGLGVVIASAFLLVPLWGPLGAALSTVAGWTTMSVVVYVISQRRMRIHYDWISTSLFVLMAAAFVFAGMELQSQPLPIRIAAITLLSLAYPVIGFLLLARSRTERGRMLHLLTKLRLAPSNQ
jgi:O-antigen/teichoic acid export membrane protein